MGVPSLVEVYPAIDSYAASGGKWYLHTGDHVPVIKEAQIDTLTDITNES